MFESVPGLNSPFSCTYSEEESSLFCIVALAVEKAGAREVSLVCELARTLIDGLSSHEFSFSIMVVCQQGSHEPFQTQERQIAIAYLPEEIRPLVIDLVCQCLEEMLPLEKPERVYRVAKGRDLPEKALLKHHRLTELLCDHGYIVESEGTDIHGRRYWMMVKSAH